MNQRLGQIIRYALSAGVLTWLILSTNMGHVSTILLGADPWMTTLAFAAYLLSVGAVAYRWRLLLIAQGIPMRFTRAAKLYFIGNFFSNFRPTSVGGDAVRALSARTDTGSRIDAFASVFVERFVGLFAIVTLALIGFLLIALQLEHTYIVPITVTLFVAMVATFPILFSRWWVDRLKGLFHHVKVFHLGERATRLHEILYRYGGNRKALGLNFLISILFQGLIVLMNVFAAEALHIAVNPIYFVVFVPAIGIISMFPFSINALGFREGGYVFLFDRIGHPAPEALALSLTLYGITVLSSVPGALFFSLGKRNQASSKATLAEASLTEG